MTLLITGVSGFLGSHAARHFSKNGWRVIGVDRSIGGHPPENVLADYHTCNLEGDEFLEVVRTSRPDVLLHAAGSASPPFSMRQPVSDYESSTLLVLRLLETLRLYAPRCHFLLISSAAVYGDPAKLPVGEDAPIRPLSPYGFHKWQSEILCREYGEIYGIPWTALRVFSAYGPGLRRQVVYDICRKALQNPLLTLQGCGNESRDFIHANDAARAMRLVAETPAARGQIYNLASGKETSIRALAEKILAALGAQGSVQFDGAHPAGIPNRWQADISALCNLGFQPEISLEEGLKETIAWCREVTGN